MTTTLFFSGSRGGDVAEAPPMLRDALAGSGVQLLKQRFADGRQALAASLTAAAGDWVGVLTAPALGLPWPRVARCLADPAALQVGVVWVGGGSDAAGPDGVVDLGAAAALQPHAGIVLFRRQLAAGLDPATLPEPLNARGQGLLGIRLLAACGADRMVQVPADVADDTPWFDPATYGREFERGWLGAFDAARAAGGAVPRWLQRAALGDIARFLTADMQARAPTRVITGARAGAFHATLQQLLQQIERRLIDALPAAAASAEVRQALLSYTAAAGTACVHLDGYDQPQGLARVTYYVHGAAPAERFMIDGRAVAPAYAKLRACNFFDRTLLQQRIAWLPAAVGGHLALQLNGLPVAIGLRGAAVSADGTTVDLARARAAFPAGKGGQLPLPKGLRGWKVRLVKALARSPFARRRYRRAWVFIDREEEGDDNAEHLYRWVRKHRPDINAWFLLTRWSPDWERLSAEGFRLMPPGLARRLMILNSEQIVSSHTDYVFGGMDRSLYGDCMQWRYTFAQHGVIKDDLSHWLNPREFDFFTTTSPAEHASIVGDGTPYPYTEREVKRVGLPRHDRLLRIAAATPPSEVDALLMMPTWRGNLIDERTVAATRQERMDAFARSDYARIWGSLMRNERLCQAVKRNGRRIVFMPHPNAEPYVDAFDAPPHVTVATARNSVVQQVFARSAGFITDYTSVAFSMALMRRQVFYYQSDRERFYGGDHNWREGYFDYERDGFGPVVFTEDALVDALVRWCDGGCRTEPQYVARMERALPESDDGACERTIATILSLNEPFRR